MHKDNLNIINRHNKKLFFSIILRYFAQIDNKYDKIMRLFYKIALILLLAATATTTAQAQVRFGIKGGVTINELCAAAGCSPAALNRTFRMATGKSPGEYALHQRIDHARALMSIHGLTLAAAAQQTGFFDASHLSHALRSAENRKPPREQDERSARKTLP